MHTSTVPCRCGCIRGCLANFREVLRWRWRGVWDVEAAMASGKCRHGADAASWKCCIEVDAASGKGRGGDDAAARNRRGGASAAYGKRRNRAGVASVRE